MELNHLRHFYEVAKSGSFAEASRRLRISQSALSKAVQLLEEDGRVQLFSRSKSGVVLTPIGQEVFARCQQAFELVDEIKNVCLERHEVCEGPLRVGASDHVTKYLLVPLMRSLKTQFPKLNPVIYSASPGAIVSSILDDETEIGLFFTQVPRPEIRYESVASFPVTLVCHPDLLPKGHSSFTPAQLRKFAQSVGIITAIGSRIQKNPSQDALEQLGDAPINFEINSQEGQKQMCLERGGLVLLFKFIVEEDLKNGTLAEIKLPRPVSLELFLATRASRHMSLNSMTLVNALRSKL